jgi:hypothetical protein
MRESVAAALASVFPRGWGCLDHFGRCAVR